MDRDIEILRALGRRIAEICDGERNAELRRLWTKHNDLAGERPMVLAEHWGVRQIGDEVAAQCQCTDPWARGVEMGLRNALYKWDQVGDDRFLMPWITTNWKVDLSDFGVRGEVTRGGDGQTMGSYVWDAPLEDLDRDFDKLHMRTFSVDREATMRSKARLEEVFDGILTVRLRGNFLWTRGLTWSAISLVGLENFMLWMIDNPDGIHRLMAFLRDDMLAFDDWLESEGLLSLNNENDGVGSGTLGATDDLPADDYQGGAPARRKDRWVLSESQETVGVSPEMFQQFVFPYQQEIAEHYGLCYYGCCEPLHARWHVVRRLGNLRSVSISPWCDQEKMASALGRDYVFSRKPAPSMISTEKFDEGAIRDDLRSTLRTARGCEVELIMKDVHTLAGEPERLGRWVELARETIDECWR